ncbi:hypothetical protein PUNSTDRAFT_144661 [Punctularia strigosozonata HHB-11173 SS5]|uniref:uncharacterized protein n=1 Tax=Punctularia strigosozonata (strain HHB-11173) TaxID=741275 RepID=UPI0004416D29|nr:uncharacterized protein PUNSTDRAFT_144661 [Punctularia strigosozonata HHB-11173 SS5]EIN07105.1 hypothetical protein PUNSTDRAFT_144661 [Punctularia strigosozonata HHB-11173 SS5]
MRTIYERRMEGTSLSRPIVPLDAAPVIQLSSPQKTQPNQTCPPTEEPIPHAVSFRTLMERAIEEANAGARPCHDSTKGRAGSKNGYLNVKAPKSKAGRSYSSGSSSSSSTRCSRQSSSAGESPMDWPVQNTYVFADDIDYSPRRRTRIACETCRTRKAKCSGDEPTCERCTQRGLTCVYVRERKPRGPGRHSSRGAQDHTVAPSEADPASDSADTGVKKRVHEKPYEPRHRPVKLPSLTLPTLTWLPQLNEHEPPNRNHHADACHQFQAPDAAQTRDAPMAYPIDPTLLPHCALPGQFDARLADPAYSMQCGNYNYAAVDMPHLPFMYFGHFNQQLGGQWAEAGPSLHYAGDRGVQLPPLRLDLLSPPELSRHGSSSDSSDETHSPMQLTTDLITEAMIRQPCIMEAHAPERTTNSDYYRYLRTAVQEASVMTNDDGLYRMDATSDDSAIDQKIPEPQVHYRTDDEYHVHEV